MIGNYDDIKMDQAYILGRTALSRGIPWITLASFHHLLEIIRDDFRVFEWGAGGSTVFFARECASVTAIEHNKLWIPRVNKMLADRGLKADLRHVQGGPKEQKDRFRKYANEILKEPDESFDLVYVDGEASSRGWCLTNALPKLKPGGWLLLDNSDWLHRVIDGFERKDYVERNLDWPGQAKKFDWWTSILRKAE